MRFSPFTHGFLALSALALIGVVAVQSGQIVQGSVSTKTPASVADVAFEHDQPLSAHVKMSILQGEALVELSHEGTSAIAVSVPEEWRRTEVRNVALDSVTAEAPMLGYTRWQLPTGGTVTFYTKNAPQNLLIHNPGGQPLKVRGILVNLNDESTQQEIVLIQQEPSLLW